MFHFLALAALLSGVPALAADDPVPGTPLVPATRAQMKEFLEGSKHHEPRLPLPPVSDQERLESSNSGGLGLVNNGRMRRYYLPEGMSLGGSPSRDEPGMTLGYPFQTKLFWIVSRANNCAVLHGTSGKQTLGGRCE